MKVLLSDMLDELIHYTREQQNMLMVLKVLGNITMKETRARDVISKHGDAILQIRQDILDNWVKEETKV